MICLGGGCETDKTHYESGCDHQLLHAMLLHVGAAQQSFCEMPFQPNCATANDRSQPSISKRSMLGNRM
jgi:hypothetical protein